MAGHRQVRQLHRSMVVIDTMQETSFASRVASGAFGERDHVHRKIAFPVALSCRLRAREVEV